MKLAILYTSLSGYMVTCLSEYRKQTSATLLVMARPADKNAPFTTNTFSSLGTILNRAPLSEQQIEESVRDFGPDAILVSGWSDPQYNRVCRKFKAKGIPVIAGCDTQWSGSLRQRVAALIAPWHVQKLIDVLWVTGERQRRLARALGFHGVRCWDGFYACDWEKFAKKGERLKTETLKSNAREKKFFLFVGRYVPEKGIRDLAAAYRSYCAQVKEPWPLVCAGKGELASLLTDVGAEDRGFVQPEDLPELMHRASAFVLPSRFEPWGVVVQEAAAACLPLIVSEACGAGVHLVRHGYNGFVTEPGDPGNLASALLGMHRLSEVERHEFGMRSFEFSKQYAPEQWAKILRNGLAVLLPELARRKSPRSNLRQPGYTTLQNKTEA